MQETKLMVNEYSVNLPTRFWYKKKMWKGWINIVNPFRAAIVLGTPGSGKSYAVVNQFIKQQIEKGFTGYIYDFKFPILTSYPDLENYLSPFMDAWLGGAADQLVGQIASAKIPLSRMISPQLYWVMSGDEFTLDINNPEDPKILVVGNNPDRQNIYGAALLSEP
ncbi:hypothetical protein FACS189435_1550 [Bacteroidia bacterium]|nr:hypothetical protein FACS189435_1550 [Bacteroidia bacterium]